MLYGKNSYFTHFDNILTHLVNILIGGWGGESNREIVSFRSFVRAGEAKLRVGADRWDPVARLCKLNISFGFSSPASPPLAFTISKAAVIISKGRPSQILRNGPTLDQTLRNGPILADRWTDCWIARCER